MSYVIILWSCALGQPLCTHPDATWSGASYARSDLALTFAREANDFLKANPTRQVVKFEVMTRARYEFEKGSYQCSQMGPGE